MSPKSSKHDPRGMTVQRVIRLVTLAVAATAVVKELRTPADERQWNGLVLGFVPYDFRVPTIERIKERFWDPEGAHVINPRVFGVGWTLNVGKVVAIAQQKVGSSS